MADPDESASPDAQRCYELIDVLEAAWTAGRDVVKVTAGVDQVFAPVLFAHVAHAVQLASSVAHLHRAGKGVAMMPTVRQVIECSIRAVWLEQYRGNVRAVVRDGYRQRKNMIDSAVAATWFDPSDDIVQSAGRILEGDDDKATSGRSFERICAELVGGERQYALYRLASALTHPGTDLVELYIDASETANSGIAFLTVPDFASADAWLGIAAQHALVAVYAWDRAELGRPYRTLLRPWAEEFGVNRTQPGMTGLGFQAANRAETRRRRARKAKQRGR
ncbi:DUF5677 domain-containing protein [Cellulomonas soli]|uniref:Uncharacterized protein n=1 Tax=Cellulomonas soli TaxID=931535 RepID=A0A512PB38_9CELL|nr:DUF5677 domain-containing protein [Cellulomonas soli]NYI57296.1 hypothetical protein [Cellulomonas soli]GEP68424.1 hypothetical protein CSO01_11390 [Cellulomonas soli]